MLVVLYIFKISNAQNDTTDIVEFIKNASLEELMNIPVVSASKYQEKINKAPANILSINEDEIKKSGYKNIVEILQTLPGFDVKLSYGSDYFHNYMRGFRSYTGSYYLILIDGVSFDHLWFYDDKILSTIPISNIQRIEIIYGPSSAIYGINALMGVINIITKKDTFNKDLVVNGSISTSFNNYTNSDFQILAKHRNLTYSITALFHNSDIKDLIDNNSYEWTKDKYLTDKKLWGNLVEHSSYGGSFSSTTQNKAIDSRIFLGDAEFAFQYYKLDPGQGVYSAFDRTRSQSRFGREESSFYVKIDKSLISNMLSTNLLIRFRKSNVVSDNPLVLAYNDLNPATNQISRYLNISLYQSLNSSWTYSQDFQFTPFEKINIISGFQFEKKNLQRDYDTVSGANVLVDDFDNINYNYPKPLSKINNYSNRMFQDETGVYIQVNYDYLPNHNIVLSSRYNKNSVFGEVFANRGALISNINKFNIKLLYGEGIQSPPPRLLYGNWQYQGKNLDLKPIKATTAEFSLSFLDKNIIAKINTYIVQSSNTILQTHLGAENVGKKNIMGIDFYLKKHFNFKKNIKKIKFWIYYSYIHAKGDEEPIYTNNAITDFYYDILGDITPNRINIGTNILINDNFSINLQGKIVDKIKTIYSNPVNKINSYYVFDTNIRLSDLFKTGLGIEFKIKNITNETFFHSGVGGASAGITPGYWENGVWNGSTGYYTSLLPQPKRYFLVSLLIDF